MFSPTALSEDAGTLPKFVEKVPNITVTVGRDALLPCTVEQLKSYKVSEHLWTLGDGKLKMFSFCDSCFFFVTLSSGALPSSKSYCYV